MFDGTANLFQRTSPVAELIAVFIPTTCPCMFVSNGPPELPGLIGASCLIAMGVGNPVSGFGSRRPIWLTIPVVIVSLNSNGYL